MATLHPDVVVSRAVPALVALLLLGTLWGYWINDELQQGVAFDALLHGHLWVTYQTPTGTVVHPPEASTMLNVLALPVAAGALALAQVLPISVWMSAAAVFCGLAAVAPNGLRTAFKARPVVWSTAFIAGLAVATWGFHGRSPPLPRDLAWVGLQVTSIACTTTSLWLMDRLVARRTESALVRGVVLTATFAGPLLFWGSHAKYHALTVLLVLACLEVADQKASRARAFAFGAVAGLALWANVGSGAVFLLGLLAAFALSLRKSNLQGSAKMSGIALLGLAFGFLPAAIENSILFGSPVQSFYFANPTIGATLAQNTIHEVISLPDRFLQVFGWTGPWDFAAHLGSTLLWGMDIEGKPIGILLLSPVLALGIWGLVRRFLKPEPLRLLSICLVLAQVLLFTNWGVRQGVGFDFRLYTPILPILGLTAVQPLDRLLAGVVPRRVLAATFVGVFGLTALIAALTLLAPPGVLARASALHTHFLWISLAAVAAAISLAWRPSGRRALALGLLLALPIAWGLLFPAVQPPHQDPYATGDAEVAVPLVWHLLTPWHDLLTQGTWFGIPVALGLPWRTHLAR